MHMYRYRYGRSTYSNSNGGRFWIFAGGGLSLASGLWLVRLIFRLAVAGGRLLFSPKVTVCDHMLINHLVRREVVDDVWRYYKA
jgi:hypothetical protein